MTIVVGAGLAGWRMAQALDQAWAEGGSTTELLIFGDESGPLDKIALGEWATGLRDEPPTLAERWLRPQSRFVPVPVVRFSLADRTVTDKNGTVYPWERLILATGSEPVVPAAFAGASRRVFPVSDRTGAAGLKAALQTSGQRVLVIGGGPLGVETAGNLVDQGHHTTLSHRGSRLLEPFLDADGSRLLTLEWSRRGGDILLDSRETAFEETPEGCRVTFEDGRTWTGQAVVLACGTRPRVALAQGAGLRVSSGGIDTDAWGQTSAPGVFAVGDCTASDPGVRAGLWAPAREQVDRMAAKWSGKPTSAPGSRAAFRLKSSWPVASQGVPGAPGMMTTVDRNGAQWKAVEDGGLVFWQVLGPWDDLEYRIAGLEAGTVSLASPPPAPHSPWPDHHVVCDCHQVTAGTVRKAFSSRAKTLGDLGRQTGAGTSCGGCRGRLLALSEAPLSPRDRRTQTFHRPRWNGWSWYDVIGYAVDFGMLVTGILTAVTGILKMPGWMETLGIDQRALPDEANMVLSAVLDLHDWPGVILTVLALVHVALHWKMLTGFLQSWFRKR